MEFSRPEYWSPFSRGLFPTLGSNPGLSHCRHIHYQLSHKGSPRILEWVAYPLPDPGIEPRSPALQVDSLPTELWRKPTGKELTCKNAGDRKRLGFDSWVGKIPWRRAWTTCSSILTWRVPQTGEPGGDSPKCCKELDMTEVTEHAYHQCIIKT